MLFSIGMANCPSDLAQGKRELTKPSQSDVPSVQKMQSSPQTTAFLNLSANKADLPSFLPRALSEMAEKKLKSANELVVAGSFNDLMRV